VAAKKGTREYKEEDTVTTTTTTRFLHWAVASLVMGGRHRNHGISSRHTTRWGRSWRILVFWSRSAYMVNTATWDPGGHEGTQSPIWRTLT
jgi:hypothetical protein